MRIICNKGKFQHTKHLFQSNKILNVYKLNILNVVPFMYKVNQKTAPNVFLSRFQKPFRFHPTRFSELNYVQPTTILKRTIYLEQLSQPQKKQITTMHKFKTITKSRLLFLENELRFFQNSHFSGTNFFYPSGFMRT